MFGNNPVRKRETLQDGYTLTVHSIFDTVQGEGPSSGIPATFVRLWGCHLKCFFCDTEFESMLTMMSLQQIASRVHSPLVVITGGEPMRQNIQWLIRTLHYAGKEVEVETSGSFYFSDDTGLWNRKVFIVSPKTPYVDHRVSMFAKAFKYPVSVDSPIDNKDGLPIVDYQQSGTRRPLAKPPDGFDRANVWLVPMDQGGIDTDVTRANAHRCYVLARRYGYRVGLQVHKYLGAE